METESGGHVDCMYQRVYAVDDGYQNACAGGRSRPVRRPSAEGGATAHALGFKAPRGAQALDVMYTVDEGEGLALESSDKVKLVTQGSGRVKDTVRLRALR